MYVADSAYCPYGPRHKDEIIQLSDRIVHFLKEKGCKLIVVACNTATAAAIGHLRAHYDMPFVGMEPAIKPAVQATQSGTIGVLATRGTFEGQHFQTTKQTHAKDVSVVIQEGTGLVELVEDGETDSLEAHQLLQRYLTPMLQAGADQLVLGCSHYPFLANTIQTVTEGQLNLVDPAPAVARQVANLLNRFELSAPSSQQPDYHFFTTGELASLQRMVQSLVDGLAYDQFRFARLQLPLQAS